MNKKIVAVCESERSLNSLKTAANDLGFDLVYEIQENDNIKNELSIYDIEDASIVLFVTSDSIESIEKIDRFIDREFYEVDPKYIIEDAKSIVSEILIDLGYSMEDTTSKTIYEILKDKGISPDSNKKGL
mgnify:CR=1 FL=1